MDATAEDKRKAHAAVARAVAMGHLQRPETMPCLACGEPAAVWHHDVSYETAYHLHVVPLCHRDHRRVHAGVIAEPRTGEVRAGDRSTRSRKVQAAGLRPRPALWDAMYSVANGVQTPYLTPLQRECLTRCLERYPMGFREILANARGTWSRLPKGPARTAAYGEDVAFVGMYRWIQAHGEAWPDSVLEWGVEPLVARVPDPDWSAQVAALEAA